MMKRERNIHRIYAAAVLAAIAAVPALRAAAEPADAVTADAPAAVAHVPAAPATSKVSNDTAASVESAKPAPDHSGTVTADASAKTATADSAKPAAAAAAAASTDTPKPGAAAAEVAARQAAYETLDAQISLLDTLVGRVPDVQQRTAVKALLDGFKDRRLALKTTFDKNAADDLRWEINVETQRLISWMAAPTVTVPVAGRDQPPRSASLELLDHIPGTPMEAQAWLIFADAAVKDVEENVAKLTGPARERRLGELTEIRKLRRELSGTPEPDKWTAFVNAIRQYQRESPAATVARGPG